MNDGDDKALVDWLVRIETKLDNIILRGCSRATVHEDHETRLRSLEKDMEQGRGAMRVASALSAVMGGLLVVLAQRYLK